MRQPKWLDTRAIITGLSMLAASGACTFAWRTSVKLAQLEDRYDKEALVKAAEAEKVQDTRIQALGADVAALRTKDDWLAGEIAKTQLDVARRADRFWQHRAWAIRHINICRTELKLGVATDSDFKKEVE